MDCNIRAKSGSIGGSDGGDRLGGGRAGHPAGEAPTVTGATGARAMAGRQAGAMMTEWRRRSGPPIQATRAASFITKSLVLLMLQRFRRSRSRLAACGRLSERADGAGGGRGEIRTTTTHC
jgi:hypothetical protein